MRTKLFCDHSPNLLALYRTGQVPLDGIEITPFNKPHDVPRLREAYAGLPFIFHASNVGRMPASLAALERYLRVCPETPWISLHLSLVPTWALFFAFRFGIGLPLAAPERLEERLIRRLRRMLPRFDRPVILENMPANRHLNNAFESDPAMIRRVLDALDVDMLLDLAHARVAAALSSDARQGLPGAIAPGKGPADPSFRRASGGRCGAGLRMRPSRRKIMTSFSG